MSQTDVTIVGVGNIGAAIVKTWLSKGAKVTMWNRNPHRPALGTLQQLGAFFEPDLGTAVSRSKLVFICVSTYEIIEEHFTSILPVQALQSPKTIINISTGTPRQARNMDKWFKARDIPEYFDGAIMVTPELVGTEHSSIFISGETEDSLGQVTSLLEHLGKVHYVSSDPGAASLWDLAALTAMDGMFYGAFMAMNVLKRQKPPIGSSDIPSVEAPMHKIVIPLMTAFLPHLADIARTLDKEDWGENFGNPASMQIKGLDTIILGLKEEKVKTDGLDLFRQLMLRVIRQKGGDAGLAAMGTYLLED